MPESRNHLSVVSEPKGHGSSAPEKGMEIKNALVRLISRHRDWVAMALMAAAVAYGASVFWKNLWRDTFSQEPKIEAFAAQTDSSQKP